MPPAATASALAAAPVDRVELFLGGVKVGEDAGTPYDFAFDTSAIAEGFIIEGQAMRLAASFGAAHTPTDATNGTDLLKLAEVALKEAKKQTATRAAFFDQRLLDKAGGDVERARRGARFQPLGAKANLRR